MLDMMRGSTANMKHIVPTTTGSRKGAAVRSPVNQMRNLGITFTTIAIGNDADTKLLQHLADIGGGKYYFAASADQVPSITLNEANPLESNQPARATSTRRSSGRAPSSATSGLKRFRTLMATK